MNTIGANFVWTREDKIIDHFQEGNILKSELCFVFIR